MSCLNWADHVQGRLLYSQTSKLPTSISAFMTLMLFSIKLMESSKLLLSLLLALAHVFVLFPQPVNGAKVICLTNRNRWCFGQSVPCPLRCPQACRVNCRACSSSCDISRCDRPGSVCQDPRFVGGDGKMFYFHGKRDQDFCILSDPELHINAHFIGKSKTTGLKRDFTWVQSLGILFGSHKLYVGARKVAIWDDSVDQLELQLDGMPIKLPSGEGAVWEEPESGLWLRRLNMYNDISVEVRNVFSLKAKIVPVTPEDSRIHKYNITSDDCFAHLDMSFQFHKLSSTVTGVLGQTYAPSYKSRVNTTSPMPIMGGYKEYLSSGLMSSDCPVSAFASLVGGLDKYSFPAMNCGTDSHGFACRR